MGVSPEHLIVAPSEELGIVDTIYEEQERPSPSSVDDSSYYVLSSVTNLSLFSSPEDGASERPAQSRSVCSALKRNIHSWFQATGLPTTVTIHVQDFTFKLHKFPLISRSGYFKRVLLQSSEVKLPSDFPGGALVFELVANFCYGSTILMDPENVAPLRCAAEFLEMTEEYGRGNLCERADLYLTQLVLPNWDDTLVVLRRCSSLTMQPLSEELLIVDRCLESLAFMACVEALDSDQQVTTSSVSSSSSRRLRNPGGQKISRHDIHLQRRGVARKKDRDWWVGDLLELPFPLFSRVVAAIRKQGMDEKRVGLAVVEYANKWILLHDKHAQEHVGLLEAVVKLMPVDRCTVPVTLLFNLLRYALAWNASTECKIQLETRIAAQLDSATVSDFILLPKKAQPQSESDSDEEPEEEEDTMVPPSKMGVDSMQRIVALFMSQQSPPDHLEVKRSYHERRGSSLQMNDGAASSLLSFRRQAVAKVAELWDGYLAQIVACDPNVTPCQFTNLADIVPTSARLKHDSFYYAIRSYLEKHPELSQQERLGVCRLLDCQKLSAEVCIELVQNNMMPLRTVVQAMFVQQQQQQQKGNMAGVDLQEGGGGIGAKHRNHHQHRCGSSSSTSARWPASTFHSDDFQFYREASIIDDGEEEEEGGEVDESKVGGVPFAYFLGRDSAFRQAAYLKAEVEATNTRLHLLEEELRALKKNSCINRLPPTAEDPPVGVTSTRRRRTEQCALNATPNSKCRGAHGGEDLPPPPPSSSSLGFCIGQNWWLQKGIGHRIFKSFRKLKNNHNSSNSSSSNNSCPHINRKKAEEKCDNCRAGACHAASVLHDNSHVDDDDDVDDAERREDFNGVPTQMMPMSMPMSMANHERHQEHHHYHHNRHHRRSHSRT